MNINGFIEKNILPDHLIRYGIRNLLRKRLKDEYKNGPENQKKELMQLIDRLKESPIALSTKTANEQHYEVPAEFFRKVLGKNLKYSCGYWDENTMTLDEAEDLMLKITCERAQLINGLNVLELGCGWGSLSLYMAENYPDSKITAVSNSNTQKLFIDNEIKKRGIKNLEIITADVNVFDTKEKYDRVVSIEMFEHMRNYKELMKKIAGFLKSNGKLFVHIFTHKEYTYLFKIENDTDWMAKYFFTDGIMPGDDLLLYFQDDLKIENHWSVNGKNYQKTANAWLENMDNSKPSIMQIFENTYGKVEALKWYAYWRVFFMSCAELWGYSNGEEWFVSHYLFVKR